MVVSGQGLNVPGCDMYREEKSRCSVLGPGRYGITCRFLAGSSISSCCASRGGFLFFAKKKYSRASYRKCPVILCTTILCTALWNQLPSERFLASMSLYLHTSPLLARIIVASLPRHQIISSADQSESQCRSLARNCMPSEAC